MSPSPVKHSRVRALRWLGGAALFAFVPKCLVCVTAYVGLAAAAFGLKLGGPELCGAPTDHAIRFAWVASLVTGVTIAAFVGRRCALRRDRGHCPSD